MTMTGAPDSLIETPASMNGQGADLLADVLSRIRLSGAMFLRGEYSAPWAFDSPESHELIELLAPGAQRLILFHIVRAGRVWVDAHGERVELETGDLAILPHATRHLMGSLPEWADPVPIAGLLPPPPWQAIPVCRFEGGGERASIACGYLRCDELIFSPFLRCLPAVFRVRPPEGTASELIRACINFVLDERHHSQGRAPLAARIPELLLAETLRLHSEQIPAGTGWLTAINDAVLSRALALLHSDPSSNWEVGRLARQAATSPSVLDERFRKLLGQSPMRYLAGWRMQVAADMLTRTSEKVASVAQAVGYGSEEAFIRAFRRHLGISPSQWRKR